LSFLSIFFYKLCFQLSRLQMPIEPIVYDTKFQLEGSNLTDYHTRYIVTRESRGYRLWHISFTILELLRVRKVGFFRHKLAAVLAARAGNKYGIWAVQTLFSDGKVIPTAGKFELDLRVEAVAKAENSDDFTKLESAWPGWLRYSTKHGVRAIDIENPDECYFEVLTDGAGFAKAVFLPYILLRYSDYYPSPTLLVYSCFLQKEAIDAGYAKAVSLENRFKYLEIESVRSASPAELEYQNQEQAINNESLDSETCEDWVNSSTVALDDQAKIVLFGSAKAASEIAWMLRADWDRCNGVVFNVPDGIAIETATKLLETELCEVGDNCPCSERDVYSEQVWL